MKLKQLGLAFVAVASFGAAGGTPDQSAMRVARESVFPAVVFVKVIQQTHEEGEKSAQAVSGSGVLISVDGDFLTNWHVVDKAESLRCLLSDGRAYPAEVIGSDKDTDLALCRLKLPKDVSVPYAHFGDSQKLVEGDPVFVMGAPWGLSRSIAAGIVSCVRRYLPGASEYTLWLQTDASVNPGNSGGPLVNGSGEVVGIIARGMLLGGNLAFAIPSHEAEIIAGQLKKSGRVNWSWTGLQLQPIRDFERDMYFDYDSGVIVSGTDEGGPARKAGIVPKDRIISVNGTRLTCLTQEDMPAVNRFLGLLEKDKPASFVVSRGKETLTVSLTPREKGKVEGDEKDLPRWNFTVKAINQFDNPGLYFYREKGLFVFAAKTPGNADDAGLRHNDILLSIDGQPVETMDQAEAVYKKAVERIDQKHSVLVTVLRAGQRRELVLDYSRDYNRR
jgi:serine protease Do